MSDSRLRVIALVASYNEERFIEGCLENLWSQGVETYLLDNGSTDRTLDIAERFLKRGLIDIETIPRDGIYSWKPILARKEELADRLDADWFMNADPDEIRLSPLGDIPLTAAFARVEHRGFNAVNFQEFTFVPTRESPDHDHPLFQNTMRHYYAFFSENRQVKAWKKQKGKVGFSETAGHIVEFPDIAVDPVNFIMKHYLFLSVDHAVKKYVRKAYDPAELAVGWHRQRAALQPHLIRLPSEKDLRRFVSDRALDASEPRQKHYLFDADWAAGH